MLLVLCAELEDPMLYILPVAQWLMSFDVVFVLILFVVYLAFLAQAKTYFAEVWLQFVICTSFGLFSVLLSHIAPRRLNFST